MRFDLKHPCKHCPFGDTETRITFACRERAEEIEESAYREGFPCHQHAQEPDDDDENGGYEFSADGSSQHCMGALMMYLKSGGANVPFENLDETEQERIEARIEWDTHPVFESDSDFIEANDNEPSSD
tara:strand:- start:2272 stop:2655 length:384 start_codon:yes stop_codon:yes gene_type:complete